MRVDPTVDIIRRTTVTRPNPFRPLSGGESWKHTMSGLRPMRPDREAAVQREIAMRMADWPQTSQLVDAPS
ncbi:MAG: hypothetical protein CW346_14500 [Bacillaceae bacterium]|nr:hypothetical protein [Bacillaceae bacterium]